MAKKQTPTSWPLDDTKTRRVSRNAACPCGKGEKYTVCCLKHDANASLFGQVLRVVKFRDRQGDDLGVRLLGRWNPLRELIQQWRDKRRVLTLNPQLLPAASVVSE